MFLRNYFTPYQNNVTSMVVRHLFDTINIISDLNKRMNVISGFIKKSRQRFSVQSGFTQMIENICIEEEKQILT